MTRAGFVVGALVAAACGDAARLLDGGATDAATDGAVDADHAPDDAPDDAPDAVTHATGCELAELEPGEALAAGTATTFDFSRAAFRQQLAGLSGAARTRYLAGQTLFEVDWLVAPAGSADRDGLGPTFNATSCRACHPDNGRAAPPLADEPLRTVLVRLGDGAPDPVYGDQLQPRAIAGVAAEGEARLRYTPIAGAFDDGAPYELLAPVAELVFALGDPVSDAVSVRVAPAVIGQGLLEAIPAELVVAAADPGDADGDGISGRARWLPGADRPVLGRFGWKAGEPSVRAQNAAALLGDLGITSAERPSENCPAPQPACAAAPTGGAPELDAIRVDALWTFVAATSVPERRDVDATEVRRGKWLFHQLGCARCHTPRWQTGAHELAGLADQAIWPYSDLLLHDLGEGLADHRADGDATGLEWRTPPLWGLGLLPVVNGHHRLLHDGRARGVIEAILWHGGEAAASAARFRALPSTDRDALEAFLRSL